MLEERLWLVIPLRPELLLHPQIPMPLHGLSPRSILGKRWWDTKRHAVYFRANFCCEACGVHKTQAKYRQWLECHEDYKIDYEKGTMEINDFVALCHMCHNYIHNHRLSMLLAHGKVSERFVYDILTHGNEVLKKANLPLNPFAVHIWNVLFSGENDIQTEIEIPFSTVKWSDWRMILEGKEYEPLWENEQAHMSHYSGEME